MVPCPKLFPKYKTVSLALDRFSLLKADRYGCILCWALVAFQFRNPIRSRQDFLDGRSARRKAATYTQNNTNTE
jgi:hypothetical protein